MAILYPPIETIKNLRQKPTEGELHALDVLCRTFNDSYEIFFQSFLNGDMPDIIVMKKGVGVYILEVKDWNLENYYLDENRDWHVKTRDGKNPIIYSPIDQVKHYKKNLFNIHVRGLLEENIKNSKNWRMVRHGVYFHKAKSQDLKNFVVNGINPNTEVNRDVLYLKSLKQYDFIGIDQMSPTGMSNVFHNRGMNSKSMMFNEKLFANFFRILSPPKHYIEDQKSIVFSKDQQKLIESKGSSRQKVKGVAGSGKTLCIAARAINANERHGEKVLILTFNISLRNYIGTKLKLFPKEFEWRDFHVIHFHEFIKNVATTVGLPLGPLEMYDNDKLFESYDLEVREKFTYKTVIIDEIQDYKKDWVDMIQNYFLDKEDGELFVCGDEKQNIYTRELEGEDKKPYTKIPGQWNLLNKSYRISSELGRLALKFQKEFFGQRYDLDEIETQENLFDNSKVRYINMEEFTPEKVLALYDNLIHDTSIKDDDICIQGSEIETLRKIEECFYKQAEIKSQTNFESQQQYDSWLKEFNLTEKILAECRKLKKKSIKSLSEEEQKTLDYFDKFEIRLNGYRRNKKFHFYSYPKKMKICTIHSFKGWESYTSILVIEKEKVTYFDSEDEQSSIEELIYTAITRCKTNLFIVNFGNDRFDSFFSKNVTGMDINLTENVNFS